MMRFLTLAAAVVLTSSLSAQGSIFIDTFDVPLTGQSVQSTVNGVKGVSTVGGLAPDVIGGERTLEVTKLEGAQASSEAQFLFMGQGLLAVNNDALTRSLAEVIWDNFGVNGYDLVTALANKGTTVDDTAILINILSIDLDFNLAFTITDTDGDFATLAKDDIDSPQLVVKPLTDFTDANAALDLNKIAELRFTATTAAGNYDRDLVVDFVKFGSPVPEPASMALMGLGSLLAGCGVMRRKRKNNAEEMVA